LLAGNPPVAIVLQQSDIYTSSRKGRMSIISKFFFGNGEVIANALVYTMVAVGFIAAFGGISNLSMQKDFYFQLD
jgi:hypothetical protein